jgi:uncharacterized lipoprotein YddW (UPF0748 family)
MENTSFRSSTILFRQILARRPTFTLWLLAAIISAPLALPAQTGGATKPEKSFKPSHKVWISLAHSTLDVRPPDREWLHSRLKGGQILETLAPARKQIAGMIVPVFDDGRALYETKVEPFAGRNVNAVQDQAALREFLAKALSQNIPVYLGLDVLAWQKSEIENRDGILSSRPEWEEFTTYGESAPPSDARFASPFHKGVRLSLVRLVEEIATRFPEAAGIVLDARFSDQHINGFGRAARAQFARESRLDPVDFQLDNIADLDLNAVLRRWMEWRRDSFAEFVGELSAAYRKRSGGRVLANGYAEYYINRDFHDVRTAQDWLGWAGKGYVDGVLLEGRWLNPFPDIDQIQKLRAELGKAARVANRKVPLFAVSTGDHLVKTSDYAKEYRSLTSRTGDLEAVVLIIRGDEDLKQAAAFATGTAVPEKPAPLAVGSPLPDFTLPLADGAGEWSPKSARGKQSIAVVLARDERLLREASIALDARPKASSKSEGDVKIVLISAKRSSSPLPKYHIHVLDPGRYLLEQTNEQFALVLVDRAGYVRRIERLPAEKGALETALAGAEFADPTPSLAVGKPAPEFTILDSAGREVRLADFRGRKNVLLTFFPKCFTDG